MLVQSQLFVHSRAHEHYQQLLPLVPGVARPLLEITEYARARPRENPIANDPAGVGVLTYTGPESHGAVERPLQFHQRQPDVVLLASVHPLQNLPFAELHYGERLALATYDDGGTTHT